MDEKQNGYISPIQIPKKYFYVFVLIFSITITINISAELITAILLDEGWYLDTLGETRLIRSVNLMTFIVGCFFIISHTWEAIMLGSAKLLRDKFRKEGMEEARKQIFEEIRECIMKSRDNDTTVEQELLLYLTNPGNQSDSE